MATPPIHELLAQLSERVATGEAFALATVIAVDGSASAGVGAKTIIDARGQRIWGWVGGGCAETAVRDAALEAIAEERPRRIRLDLEDEVLGVGMPCGGHMEIFIEPMTSPPKLLVLGHGRIAERVAASGTDLGFHVTVNDALASETAFPRADVRVVEDPDYAKAEVDARTYVVITTQHKSDYEALSRVLAQSPAYVGLVASRKRSALLFERLHEDGFDAEALRRVSAPAGLDLGAVTPEEIAVSIVSEVLQRRRGGETSGRPLAEVKGVGVGADGVQVPDGPGSADKCPR